MNNMFLIFLGEKGYWHEKRLHLYDIVLFTMQCIPLMKNMNVQDTLFLNYIFFFNK